MFLSISIPVYNAAKTLDQCINSIIEQTFKDYELVLVDDGSTDNSLQICNKWALSHPDHIRVIQKKNSGSLLTRRRCLQECVSEYLYIMDADDYLVDKDALRYIYEAIKETDPDVLIFEVTTDLKTRVPYLHYGYCNSSGYCSVKKKQILYDLISSDKLNSLWNKVFKRELVDWDDDYNKYSYITNGTDQFQIIPIISKADKFIYLNRILYFYRTSNNSGSIIHKFNPNLYKSLKANFNRLKAESRQWNVRKDKLDTLLGNRFMIMASTCAYKVRLINDNRTDKVGYLKSIGEDDCFREEYKRAIISEVPFSRRIIIDALYYRHYKLLLFTIFISKILDSILRSK